MAYQPNYKYIPPFEFDFLTPIYDYTCSIIGLGKGFRQQVLKSVEIKSGQTILDVGCGTGVFLEVLKQKYPNVKAVGVDPDKKALKIACKRLADEGIELKESFAESLPLGDQSVDIVFSSLAFHHMPSVIKQKAIQEIHRVLRPGGKVVIADFGPMRNRILARVLFFWEKFEYLEGNLKGLIPQFLNQTGFRNVHSVATRSVIVEIIVAEK